MKLADSAALIAANARYRHDNASFADFAGRGGGEASQRRRDRRVMDCARSRGRLGHAHSTYPPRLRRWWLSRGLRRAPPAPPGGKVGIAGCRVCVQCCLPRREHNTRRLSDLPIFTDVSFGICVCSFMKTRYCGRAGRSSSRKYTLMLRPASQLSDNVSRRRARYVTRETCVTAVYAGTTGTTSGRSS